MSNKVDWNKIQFRCSCLGLLMTDPRAKEAKENGDLSKTTKTYLHEIYINEKYGREKEEVKTKQMAKGTSAESIGIKDLSVYKRDNFKKNEERIYNNWLKGTPDIYKGESIMKATSIIDTKLSWDLFSYIPNISDKLDSNYDWQLHGYFDITGATEGSIAYVLVDCPDDILMDESYRLLTKMKVVSEESEEYVLAVEKLKHNLTFPDIPLEERVLLFPVYRDDEKIERIHKRVEKCREYLAELEQKHLNFNNISPLPKENKVNSLLDKIKQNKN